MREHLIDTEEAFGRWQREYEQVNAILKRIEQAEVAMLVNLGCPTDLAAVYAILSGEQKAPWPRRTTARDRQRARHAMHALSWIATARRHLALGEENARLAAHAACSPGSTRMQSA